MTSVSVAIPDSPLAEKTASRPAHHLNDCKTSFTNPWASYRFALSNPLKILSQIRQVTQPSIPPNITELIGSRTPDWGFNTDPGKIKATWLGHACFLVELPSPTGASRGPRILFDPVFSKRCSPTQWVGPARYTDPPCALSEVPEVDIIVYSHNHYDHLDKQTLLDLLARGSSSSPRIHAFAPLNNDYFFESLSIPSSNYHCLDWWDNRAITVSLPSGTAEPVPTTFRLTCTPCQHFSGRGIFDRFSTLWSSWAVEADIFPQAESTETPKADNRAKVWFAGDTGYRSIRKGEDESQLPVCPAFREIGDKFGGFDLALIPIGAYAPRFVFSAVHCAPEDSVCLFRDVRARKAIGMHWGAWALTSESPMAPVERLTDECKKAGIPEGAFGVCEIGETTVA